MTTTYIADDSICPLPALIPGTSHTAPVKVGNYVIPNAFARSLEQGMMVPAYIRYNETDEKSQQEIADAAILLVDGNIAVKALTLAGLPNNAVLSEKTHALVEKIHDVKFHDNTNIELSDDARP